MNHFSKKALLILLSALCTFVWTTVDSQAANLLQDPVPTEPAPPTLVETDVTAIGPETERVIYVFHSPNGTYLGVAVPVGTQFDASNSHPLWVCEKNGNALANCTLDLAAVGNTGLDNILFTVLTNNISPDATAVDLQFGTMDETYVVLAGGVISIPVSLPTPTPTATPTIIPTVVLSPTTPAATPVPVADFENDGIPDAIECVDVANCEDADGDTIPNHQDIDSDGDGIPDAIEAQGGRAALRASVVLTEPVDNDGDTIPDYLDTDSDNDSIPDAVEAFDGDADGRAGINPTGQDSDGDGLDDAYDTDPSGIGSAENALGSNAPLPDHDGDGIYDWYDTDDDGDTIPTRIEVTLGGDPDGDGLPNYLDEDSDGDQLLDGIEVGADPLNPLDNNNNGIPDLVEVPTSIDEEAQPSLLLFDRVIYLPLIEQ